jgi:hypothetical protein
MKTSENPQSVKETRKRMCIIFLLNGFYIVFLLYRKGFPIHFPEERKSYFVFDEMMLSTISIL